MIQLDKQIKQDLYVSSGYEVFDSLRDVNVSMFDTTNDLLKAHPAYFGNVGLHGCWAHSHKAGVRPTKITFILSQPRSGSTLLMRLMNNACMSLTIGDHPVEFYKSFVELHKVITNSKPEQHCSPIELEKRFIDEYRGTSILRDRFALSMAVRMLLFREYGSGYAKSCMIGFGNDLVKPFCDMLRDLFTEKEGYQLTIAFLTRDHDEIAESMSGHPDVSVGKDYFLRLLYLQKEKFREVAEIDDVRISYKKLCEDPIGVLKKLNTLYSPNIKAVNEIMKNKLSGREAI